MDLFGSLRTMSLGGNYYTLVVVDDFFRFTRTMFLHSKSEAYSAFKKLAKRLQNSCCSNIGAINTLCDKVGIFHNFSVPPTPQQNGVVERKNRSLEELARTILNESFLPKYFWADAVSTTCYVMNRVLIRPILKKTPYELLNGKKPHIGHLKVFGCKCYILNNGKDKLGKFDEKVDNGIFLRYSLTSHAYRVYNKRLVTIEEFVHVVFYQTNNVEQRRVKFLKNLENCPENQPVILRNNRLKIYNNVNFLKSGGFSEISK